mgnify:CR=1 FL=1
MSTVRYRLGRFAARRPWLVIGSWFLLAAAVVVANSTVGRDFEDTFTVPGQDSDDALVLLEAAQLDAAGASAQLVIASVVPGEPITDDRRRLRDRSRRSSSRTRAGALARRSPSPRTIACPLE